MNELIGTILLMAIAVGLVGVFILVLFSIPGPAPASHSQVQAYVLPTTPDQLIIEHRGGPPIPISQLVATVTVNGTGTRYDVGSNLAGSWKVVSSDGRQKSATESFDVGDQAIFTSATLYKATTSVTLVDANAAALTLGATTLKEADTVAPALTSARTTSTTTITATFSEALRSISASDFTVGGSAPSSVTLLGNGSSAELTIAAIATSATPAVATVASPSGSVDLAGNAIAGGTSVTPADGIAPAITVGAVATPATTTASVTWTTGESGTSTVSYGPTPSDLSISASGASGTSHTVALSGLADNFPYYYQVATTDAAGNTVTSSTGSFTTLAAAATGGGTGDQVPPHLIFNQTVASIATGTPSAAGTPFRVALRNATNAVVTAASTVTVALTTNSSTGYFLDADGVTQITSKDITAGNSFTEFRYVDFRNGGSSVIGATASNTTPVYTIVAITGTSDKGAPFRLEWSTQQNSVFSGIATADLTISLRDALGNLVNAPYNVQVNLSTNSSIGYFTSLGATVTSMTIPSGSSSTTTAFQYVDDRAVGQTSLVTASAQGILPASMQVLVTGTTSSVFGVGNRLEFTSVPASLASGSASATDYVVTMKNAAQQAILPDTPLVVRLSTNSSFGYFLDTDGVTPITTRTLTTSNGTAWFKYVDYRSNGTTLLTASANGTTAGSATVAITGRSVAGELDHLAFSQSVATNASGIVSGPFQLQLRDVLDQQTTAPSALTIKLLTNSTAGWFCSDATCTSRISTIAIASGGALSSQFWYQDSGTVSVLTAQTTKITPAIMTFAVTGGAAPPRLNAAQTWTAVQTFGTNAALDATDITSGTLADARTSSNIAKLGTAQTWTATQTFGTNAALDATDITSGTLADARTSSNIAKLGTAQTWTAVQTFGTNAALDATDITSGTLADARTSSNIAKLGTAQTWTALQTFGTNAALDATDITSGTLSDSRLSTNVDLLNGAQTVSGAKTYNAGTLKVNGGGTGSAILAYGSTGTTSTATLPTNNGTIAELNLAQTWSATQTFGTNAALDATDITSGTLADARTSSNIAKLGTAQSWTAVQTFGTNAALDATDITSGTLADARTSSNIAKLGTSQSWTAAQTFGAGATISSGQALLLAPTATGSLPTAAQGLLVYDSTTNGLKIGTGAGTYTTPAVLSTAQTWTALQTFGTNAALDATDITSGTLADARTSSNIAKLGTAQTWTAVQTFGTNAALDATDITSGTLSDSRLSTNVDLLNGAQTVSGAKTYNAGTLKVNGGGTGSAILAYGSTGTTSTATLPTNNGTLAELNLAQTWTAVQTFGTNAALDATDITSGTLADARTSSNIAKLGTAQSWTAAQTFGSGATVSSGQALLLTPTATGSLPAAAAGELVYDSTINGLKIGTGASYSTIPTWKSTGTVSITFAAINKNAVGCATGTYTGAATTDNILVMPRDDTLDTHALAFKGAHVSAANTIQVCISNTDTANAATFTGTFSVLDLG